MMSNSGKCLSLLIVLLLIPVVVTDSLCDFVTATNIQTLNLYSQWSCSNSGACCSPVWPGLICNDKLEVISINLGGIGLKGNVH